jgi:hypothetical protein
MKKTILTADKVVTIETTVTERPRVVQYEDIVDAMKVEFDDWNTEAPWEQCDGWEHDARQLGYYDHEDLVNSRGYARTDWNEPNMLIEVDDDVIVDQWGCDGYHGASKQVRFELIAQVKRRALDQLVKWYENGWSYYTVGGEYEDQSDHIGGVDCLDYAEELRYECADNVVNQLESEGFIVEGQNNPHDRAHRQILIECRKQRNQSHIVEVR